MVDLSAEFDFADSRERRRRRSRALPPLVAAGSSDVTCRPGSAVPDRLRDVVDVGRHPVPPLLVAHVGGELGAHRRRVPQPHRVVAAPEARRLPSGLNATLHTRPVWPVRVADGLAGGRVPQPHRLVVAGGGEPVPSGLNATLCTASVWPVRVADGLAGGRRPTAAPCCRPPEAMRVPSGLNATLDTASVWPGERPPGPGRWPRPTAAPSCRRRWPRGCRRG